MRDFEKIEWKNYNRPPFYQQWLCRDDTLKLASFGDRGLAEVDDQIRAIKDQWDLDTVKGHFLDRIGKLLNEKRNGNTDAHYRILLKLRRLLNTNDGSIPQIIEAIKFIYSSEIIHIVADYPAGLIIEHDGEGNPGLNFNKLLAEIIPAGVSFSTKELFYFTEELPPGETMSNVESVTSMRDYMGYVFHNGVYRRNGQIRRQYNGAKDSLSINLGYALQDRLYGRTLHNGLFRRNGDITRSGFIRTPSPATEILVFNLYANHREEVPSSENAAITLFKDMSEAVEHENYHNGAYRRNGVVQRTNRVYDQIAIAIQTMEQERMYGTLQRNGVIRRNGSERRDGFTGSPNPATEKIVVTATNRYSEEAQCNESFSITRIEHGVHEDFHKKIRRNSVIRRDGRYNRASGISEIQGIRGELTAFGDTLNNSNETLSIGYRKHHFHNGVYRRNRHIKHDANILIPL
jgi:hypothetical protein